MTAMEQRFYEELRESEELTKEQLELIYKDITYGISKEDIRRYAKRNFNIKQMKIISNCFRRQIDEATIQLLLEEQYNEQQMLEIVQGIKSDLSYEQIKSYADAKKSAFNMFQIRKQLMAENNSKNQNVEDKASEQMFMNISEQIKTYYENNLQIIQKQQLKEKEDEMKKLHINLAEKDKSIVMIQNENRNKTEQIQMLEEKILKYKRNIEFLQEKDEIKKERRTIGKLSYEHIKQAIDKEERQSVENRNNRKQNTLQDKKNLLLKENTEKNCQQDYQLILNQSNKKVFLDIEQQDLAENKRRLNYAMLHMMFRKNKKQENLLKMIVGKELSAEQLEQIYYGIDQGVTVKQLSQIMSHKHGVEQMKVLIEIAVLQNNLQQ